MNIENFRLSNLTEKQITDYINYEKEGKCVVIECHVRKGTNLVNIKHHIGVSIREAYSTTNERGNYIAYDGALPSIPIKDIKKYETFFLCKEHNANNLAKELINHYGK